MKLVAVTLLNPEMLLFPSNSPVPFISPPMKMSFAIPTPPLTTREPVLILVELRVLLRLAIP